MRRYLHFLKSFNSAVAVAAIAFGTGMPSAQAQAYSGDAEIPGVVILRNLPRGQQIFRIDAVRAVDSQIYEGADISLATYEDRARAGWRVIQIPRGVGRAGKGDTIIHMKVSSKDRQVDVAVRGTANFDDVLVDLNAAAQMDEVLQVPLHSGFQAIAQDVYAALQRELSPVEFQTYGFRLFGHSLGGAVAAIVSMYLHQQDATVKMVATFGAPRFTTNEGARKYQVLNQRTYRVVRCDDVVPFLPPPNFFGWSTGSYEANGNILLLLAPPYFDYSEGLDIERDFIHQLRNELSNAAKRTELAFGHRMKNYADLLIWFTGEGVRARSTVKGAPPVISPISYTLALQSQLCPPRLNGAK